MKKSVLAMALAAMVLMSGCSGVSQESDSFVENISTEQGKYIIDYGDAESFEATLNEGKNLEGKIVCFVAGEFHPDSALGYNVWAGEHLNFVSSSHPDIQEGDTVIVKVTTVKRSLGSSWIINYEKIENAVANDDTIVSSKDNSTPETDESSPTSSTTSTEEYKKENFIVGATKYNDWYYKETAGGSIDAVLYVGDFSEIDDIDEFIGNFYTGLYNIIVEAPHHGLYMYKVLKENGDCVGTTALAFGVTIPVVWIDDYKPLNDNENAKVFDDIWSINGTETLPSSSQLESSIPPVQDTVTTGERNALKKAQSYLNVIAFSRDRLIGQLEYEGFSQSEATYGADNVGANWNEQAVKKAKSYLDSSAFSYSRLVDQLEYEKFTHEQAVYGVDNCGANWNEQAVKKAASYLELGGFSKDRLISQLEFEGFTHDQAVYGAAQNGY